MELLSDERKLVWVINKRNYDFFAPKHQSTNKLGPKSYFHQQIDPKTALKTNSRRTFNLCFVLFF